ncbi:hypothetical protein BVY04_03680 [bacterium M21]|nr:hypothetical protein BVY04_03680 [bacterium M21]
MVALTLQSLHCAREGILDSRVAHLSELLQQKRLLFEAWTQERENGLIFIRKSPAIRDVLKNGTESSTAAARDLLGRYRINHSELSALTLINSRCQVVLASDAETQKQAQQLCAALQHELESRRHPMWHFAHPEGSDTQANAHLVLPIQDAHGEFIGHLIGTIRLQEMMFSMQGAGEFSPNSSLKLLLLRSANLECIAAPLERPELSGHPYALPTGFNRSGKEASLYSDAAGTPVLGAGIELPNVPWLLIAEVDQYEVFGMLRFLLRRAGYSFVAVLITVVVIALVLSNIIATPFRALKQVCSDIRSGGKRRRLGRFSTAEADDLANSFDTMMDQLEQTRQQLVQAETLAAIGELSASLVHEMRNPLNTVQMNLQALGAQAELDDRYRELYELALRQTNRLHHMLNELLNYGAKLELKRTDADLVALLGDVVQQFELRAEENDVKFMVSTKASPLTVHVDVEQMYRAIGNLIDNALAMSPAASTISITIEDITESTRITIADQGPGVQPALMEKIFLPMFTTREDGSGLGLPLVRKIAQLHGGTITVTSPPSGGASFQLMLPKGTFK